MQLRRWLPLCSLALVVAAIPLVEGCGDDDHHERHARDRDEVIVEEPAAYPVPVERTGPDGRIYRDDDRYGGYRDRDGNWHPDPYRDRDRDGTWHPDRY